MEEWVISIKTTIPASNDLTKGRDKKTEGRVGEEAVSIEFLPRSKG